MSLSMPGLFTFPMIERNRSMFCLSVLLPIFSSPFRLLHLKWFCLFLWFFALSELFYSSLPPALNNAIIATPRNAPTNTPIAIPIQITVILLFQFLRRKRGSI
jgi:hypothetical protein